MTNQSHIKGSPYTYFIWNGLRIKVLFPPLIHIPKMLATSQVVTKYVNQHLLHQLFKYGLVCKHSVIMYFNQILTICIFYEFHCWVEQNYLGRQLVTSNQSILSNLFQIFCYNPFKVESYLPAVLQRQWSNKKQSGKSNTFCVCLRYELFLMSPSQRHQGC